MINWRTVRMKRLTLITTLVIAGWLTPTPPRALAHGIGTPQVVNAPVGPYLVWIYTDPEPIQVGEMHLSLAVVEPATSQALTNITATVQMRAVDAPTALITATASSADSLTPLLLNAVLAPPSAGQWQVQVQIDGPLGVNDVGFTVTVTPEPGITWTMVLYIALGILFIGRLLWFFRPRPPTPRMQRRAARRATGSSLPTSQDQEKSQ